MIMEIKPIKTEKDYTNSIKRIETLWGAKKDSIEGDELDLLVTSFGPYPSFGEYFLPRIRLE